MLIPLLIMIAAFALGIVYSSFFEWSLHKYIMHSPKLLKYAHRAHQIEHHGMFKADATYFITDPPAPPHTEDSFDHMTFAWWNAPLLVGLHLPLFALAWFFGGWPATAGFGVALIGYYFLYEYVHYCMHMPANRWFERTHWFKFVNTHHRLHHVYFMKNLNVVIPIADFILRTRVAYQEGLFEKLEDVRNRRDAQKPSDPAAGLHA